MNYFKNNKTYQNLKHIKSVLPENIKKLLNKNKQKFNNLDDIKNNWANQSIFLRCLMPHA